MKLSDYLIEHTGKDWRKLLEAWRWMLPPEFTIWMVNRFGELILVTEDGSVHYLDIGGGALKRIADSRDHFSEKIDEDNNANDWLMIPLVDRCVAAGFAISPDECYAFRQLPALGGDYTVENVRIAKLAGYYGYAGLVHEKIRDYPDGTQVEIRVAE